jgi:hypothetical protein
VIVTNQEEPEILEEDEGQKKGRTKKRTGEKETQKENL